MRRLLCSVALLAALTAPAHASEADRGLHIQLSAEMKNLAARSAWSGVDTHYARLMELEARGEQLTAEEHLLGAEAARGLGNMASCRNRLERAQKVGDDPAVASMLADITANYGDVTLLVEGKHDPQLVPDVPPFAPDQRTAIAYVNQVLTRDDRFAGLLPAGNYQVAGGSIEVDPGEPLSATLTTTGVRLAGAATRVAEPTTRPDRPIGLIAATGAAAVASGVCYGLALGSKSTFLDTENTSYAQLDGLATRTNVLGGIAVGGGVATLGLGVALALAW